jgi:two-component system KDP operon response regulator KdpE
VVDDDSQIRSVLRISLTVADYQVEEAQGGEEALRKVREFQPDLVLLDINMPGMSGIEVCRSIRAQSKIAIIMLTVRNLEADKVAALDAGADDFVTKPFSAPELLARVRAALRRLPHVPGLTSKVRFGDLVIDFATCTVSRGPRNAHLTPKEIDVLRFLIDRADQPVSHQEILSAVWGLDYSDHADYLRVLVRHLRKKIEVNPNKPFHLTTQPWIGYRFNTRREG